MPLTPTNYPQKSDDYQKYHPLKNADWHDTTSPYLRAKCVAQA